jgi:hypothetical protein
MPNPNPKNLKKKTKKNIYNYPSRCAGSRAVRISESGPVVFGPRWMDKVTTIQYKRYTTLIKNLNWDLWLFLLYIAMLHMSNVFL